MTDLTDDARQQAIPAGQPCRRLDTRGQRCPYPVIELGRAWSELRHCPGRHAVLITADDPVAIIDIPAWCDIKSAQCTRLDDDSTSDIIFRVEFDGATES